ncbi:hypothetical protein ACWF7H_09295 [Peribacillus butanolivorans]|uniref:hypothetical protein n=1 Tax=Peribacillus butanolivorans TaxID=421767 RepID=UPI0036823BDD
MKVAILDNGYSFHHRFFQMEEFAYMYDDVLQIRQLHTYDLSQYDTLIVNDRMSLLLLKRYQSYFIKFLQEGKRLVVFGEVLDNWLPGVYWENSEVNFSWWVKEHGDLPLKANNIDHPLYQYVCLSDMKWHYHGTFKVPEGAKSLVDTPDGRSIIYIDDLSYNGELVITTLDPIFHIGLGFIDQSRPFLHGVAKWLREEARGRTS